MFSKVIWSVITLVVLLTVVGLIYWLTVKPLKCKTQFKLLKINPLEKITSQPLFWLCISLPVTLGLMLGFPVWIKYSLGYDAEAYATFIEISALPLGFILCAMYLVHVLLRVHSSSQTAQQLNNQYEQIKIQTEQLKNQRDQVQLKNYLDFKDYIIEKLEAIEKNYPYEIKDKHTFFALLFPNFSPANCDLGELNSKPKFLIDLLDEIYDQVISYLENMENNRSRFGIEHWDVYPLSSEVDLSKRIKANKMKVALTQSYLARLEYSLFKNGIFVNTDFRFSSRADKNSGVKIVHFYNNRNYFTVDSQHEMIIDFLKSIYSKCLLGSPDTKNEDMNLFNKNKISVLSSRFEDCTEILDDYISDEKSSLHTENKTKQPTQPE